MTLPAERFSIQLTRAAIDMQSELGRIVDLDPALAGDVLARVKRLAADTGVPVASILWVDVQHYLYELGQNVKARHIDDLRLYDLFAAAHVRLELLRAELLPEPSSPEV